MKIPLPEREDQKKLEKVKRARTLPGYMRNEEKKKLMKRQKAFFSHIEKYNSEDWKFYEINFEGRVTLSTKEGEIVNSCSSTHNFQLSEFSESKNTQERMHIF